MNAQHPEPCDVVILTALQVEFQAVCAHLTDRRPHRDPDGTAYQLGRFDAGDKSLDIAVTETGPRNPRAAAATEHVIGYLRPRAAIFVGVAGGLKDVKLYDVVAATKVYGYESGKVLEAFKPRPETGKSTLRMEQGSRAVAHDTAWHARICPRCPDPPPRALVAPIASGEKVIADIDSSIYELLGEVYSDALCVEMEGEGFLEAASRHREVEALLVRGISDLIADKELADAHGSQETASAHAAAFAFEVLATVELPPRVEPPKPQTIWNVPHLRNPNFTGREEMLRDLRESLASGNMTALTQAIHGLGGVGKTQLAVEYAYRHQGDYEIVWWVRSEQAGTLASDYALLAQRLHLPEKDEADQTLIRDAVRDWLRCNTGWLLVFDNVNKPEDIHDYTPQGDGGHTIITSRRSTGWRVRSPLRVDVWKRAESIRFVTQTTGQRDRKSAGRLADALGNLPLALAQAAGYMERCGKSVADYLKLFESRGGELLATEDVPEDYDKIVATTWDISFEAAKEECPACADLLNLCAFLAPDDIPLDIIREGADELPDSLRPVAADQLKLDEAVGALHSYSLADLGPGTISMHRLVQQVTRDRLGEEETKAWAESAVRVMNNAMPAICSDVASWPECARLLPHALTSAGHAEGLGVALEATARVFNQVGLYLKGRAEYGEAKNAYQRALSRYESALGPESAEVATVLNNLGNLLKDMGELPAARTNLERALAIDEKALGPDHPSVAIRLSNLGLILRDMGDLPAARTNLERALAIFEAQLAPEHPNVGTLLSNLGTILHAMGDLPAARTNLERALAIDEKALGPDHPKVAIDIWIIGTILRDMGDLEVARKNIAHALGILERRLGDEHPTTARARNDLEHVLARIAGKKPGRGKK